MFSIVIPLYNKEKYIAETLNSVLNQSFNKFEVIIVNDGSTDNSARVVEGYNDNRIRLIEQKNSGVSAARNKGIKEARYDWIAFLDADDKWEQNFLVEINNAISKFPNRSIFSVKFIKVRESESNDSLPIFISGEELYGEINLYKSLAKFGRLPINSSSAVIRKKHLDEFGYFPEGRKNYEDHDLWLRLCIKEPIVFINKKLSFIITFDNESASKGIFLSKDFISFIHTFINVENQLSPKDKYYFKKYYNKFVLINYLSKKKFYTDDEIKNLRNVVNMYLSFPYNLILNLITLFNLNYDNINKVFRLVKKRLRNI